MKNKMVVYIIIVIVLVGGAFYGGMKYGQGTALKPQALENLSQTQRQQLFAGMRGGSGQANRGGSTLGGNGFANGEIISQTDKNITLKLRDGSSKIILIADSTKINKAVDGQKTDLVAGKQVSVNGTVNSDGTITAGSITIVPLLAAPDKNKPAPTNDSKNLTPTSPVKPAK